MKLSVMLFPFYAQLVKGSLDADTLIKTLKDNGAEAVETMHGFEIDSPDLIVTLLDAVQKNGLEIACHDIGINLIGEDKDRAERLEQARAQIDFAHDVLNTRTVLLFANRQADGVSCEEGRRIYAQSLAQMADYAEKRGITVTIENFDPTPELACAARHCHEILELAGPKPRLTFDTGNFLAVGENAVDAFAILGNRIGHVHVKDVVPNPDIPGKYCMCIAGQGIAQIDKCIGMLKNIGYQEYLSVELAGATLEDNASSLRYLRCLL